ncbi:MAG: hypothetical protein AB1Z98_05835 [Nannocystaceae bacterium]
MMTTLSLLLSATFALAPQPPAPAADEPQDADDAALVSTEGQTSVYEFADDQLTGEHLSPDGSLIPWRRPPHHESLIELRGFFTPELVRLGLDV